MNKFKETIYIVGNKFSDFAKNEGVYTLKTFLIFANEVLGRGLSDVYEVILGQGLSELEVKSLSSFFSSSRVRSAFYYLADDQKKIKASQQMTHKHKASNILISKPISDGDLSYESSLMVDDECAEMQDHLTGEHLQAMLLIESARQMMTATAESFWLKECERNHKSFVLDNFSTKFVQYIFPLEVTLQLKVISFRKGFGGNFKSDVTVNFVQNGKVKMQCAAEFSAMDKNAAAQLERTLANQCILQASGNVISDLKVA